MATRIITVDGVDASGRGYPAIGVADFDKQVGFIKGANIFTDPEAVPNATVNGASAQYFKDRATGMPWRALPSNFPTVYNDPTIANGKPLFETALIAECGLKQFNNGVSGTYTIGGMFRPTAAQIGTPGNPPAANMPCYFYRSIEGNTGRTAAHFNPTGIIVQDETAGTAFQWTFSTSNSPFVIGTPVAIVFMVDATARTCAIYVNSSKNPAASGNFSGTAALASYPLAQMVMFGAALSQGSLRGRAGRWLGWPRILNSAELTSLLLQLTNYYGIV